MLNPPKFLRPKDQTLAAVLGIGVFVLGSLMIRDAFEGRGRSLPKPLRPFSWW